MGEFNCENILCDLIDTLWTYHLFFFLFCKGGRREKNERKDGINSFHTVQDASECCISSRESKGFAEFLIMKQATCFCTIYLWGWKTSKLSVKNHNQAGRNISNESHFQKIRNPLKKWQKICFILCYFVFLIFQSSFALDVVEYLLDIFSWLLHFQNFCLQLCVCLCLSNES